MQIGIIGLPNVGKSTLFSCLAKRKVDISNYPFCTIKPNQGIVEIPDSRLDQLAKILNPSKVIPSVVEFVDLAGLVKGAHQGQGLGNQFLAHIREMDLLIHLVRLFENQDTAHLYSTIDPQRDIELINYELMMKDLETVQKLADKIKKKYRTQKDPETIQTIKLLKKLQTGLEQGRPLSGLGLSIEEIDLIRQYNFLSLKPVLYLFNLSGNYQPKQDDEDLLDALKLNRDKGLCLCLKNEADLMDLSQAEQKELGIKSQLDLLIQKSYKILNQATFFTVQHSILQSWTIQKGSLIIQAAEKIHTDFKEKFIKAEIIKSSDLIRLGSEDAVRKKGLARTAGRNYPIEEGDLIKIFI